MIIFTKIRCCASFVLFISFKNSSWLLQIFFNFQLKNSLACFFYCLKSKSELTVAVSQSFSTSEFSVHNPMSAVYFGHVTERLSFYWFPLKSKQKKIAEPLSSLQVKSMTKFSTSKTLKLDFTRLIFLFHGDQLIT
jgi:hypothetical protein